MIGPLQRLRLVWSHPANRGHRGRAVLRGVAWLAYRLVLRRPLVLRGPGFRFLAWPDSAYSRRMVLYSGRPDYHEMVFLERYLRPGDGVLDVGANIGIYSLLAGSRVGVAGRVEAFEPTDASRRRLRRNLELNGFSQVRVHREAVGALRGRVRFRCDGDVGNRIQAAGDEGRAALEVPCVRLDDVVAGRRWAVGKIDVEGAEPLVLAGAPRALAAANPPVWVIEINGKLHDFGFTEEEFEARLQEAGYDLALYDADRRRLRFGRGLWRRRSSEPGAANFLAIARAAHEGLRRRLGDDVLEGPCSSE